jgi:hypothetical protein
MQYLSKQITEFNRRLNLVNSSTGGRSYRMAEGVWAKTVPHRVTPQPSAKPPFRPLVVA